MRDSHEEEPMTAKLLVLYPTPQDPAAFDAYYVKHHLPLVRAVAGLRTITRNRGPIGAPGGPSTYHQVSTYVFGSMAELQQGLGSPEGQAAAADLANFAPKGTEMLLFEEHEL
jgi:uncharacterized protein (TIGR02118 family)